LIVSHQRILRVTFYRDDLALIHDDGFGHVARGAAEFLIAELLPPRPTASTEGPVPRGRRQSSPENSPRPLIVDLGCGTGILAERLTAVGYDVLGYDISPGMIALAKRRAPQARFELESFLDAALPRCRAVTSISECLNYAFDEANSLPRLAELFARIHAALESGGFLMFDILQPGVFPDERIVQRFRQTEEWSVLVELQENQKEHQLTRRITTFRKIGKHYRRDDETHCVRLYRGADLARALRQTGFRVRRLTGYGTHPFSGSQTGFLARKP